MRNSGRRAASASLLAGALLGAPGLARTQSAGACNAPTPEPIVHVALPGNPFAPVVTPDGCWIFVAMAGNPAQGGTPGVAVIQRAGGALKLLRTVPLKAGGTGAVLTHDAKTLIVAAGADVAFLDADKLKSGSGDPVVGYLDVGEGNGAIYVSVTKADDILFVALERAASILVVDLAKIRRGTIDRSAVLGSVPVGNAPIAVTLSNDETYLYNTSQAQVPSWNWPIACRPEGQPSAAPNHSKGAVVVIDVAKARTDAPNAVITRFAVGCNPVRLVLSPDGATIWVSTRGDHALVALDTKKLVTDSAHAVIARLKVGTAPVGIAVTDGGRRVIATNSNRFAGDADDKQSLNVVDVTKGAAGATLVGIVPAGAFPRELRVTPDGRTLLVSNFASKTLQVVDLQRLPIKPAP